MTAERVEVRPGQIWADNDPRSEGRTIRIEFVGSESAACRILANPTAAHADRRGKITRIRLDRFRPTSNGYRLLGDSSGEPSITRTEAP